ncbi:membrane fusion protein, multidrug efflux system [Azotobacter beijerinckii]|uniref:Membrane fusion protein, multidrug efflux system n=1 Tax=Azotobacter beijerinckii TaxID=170623 RepID=A0A1H9M2D8_9GAMM|nr:HlyD family secretion protein [Azotobacter beijerinckii]SER17699.1 membrane fusion protein, multidrug efflux system [Azotobacter beijerinckii]
MSLQISRRTSLALVAVLAIALLGYLGFRLLRPTDRQSTDNAYVRADFTLVAPKVSGQIVELLVEDNQIVRKGQPLVRIDPRDYQAAEAAAAAAVLAARAQLQRLAADLEQQQSRIAAAQAQVAADRAEHTFARQELTRHENLAREGAGSLQLAQQARSRIGTSQARLDRAEATLATAQKQVAVLQAGRDEAQGNLQRREAELEQARLRLSYTEILAPLDGMVGQRAVRVGAYVKPGQALLAVVPLQSAYVVANFRETQLTQVAAGQPVSVRVDTFPDAELRGHVDSVAPASGLSFAPIAPSNATGNFTKIVQRIPVKILLEPGQPLLEKLRVGMSVVATIDTRTGTTPAGGQGLRP